MHRDHDLNCSYIRTDPALSTSRVLQLLTEPLLERGYGVLRYNSRGVGKSTGWASFTGIREAEDLKELVQWTRSEMPHLSSLVLAVRGLSVRTTHHSHPCVGLLPWIAHRFPPSCPGRRPDFAHLLVIPYRPSTLAHRIPRLALHHRTTITPVRPAIERAAHLRRRG